MKNKRSKYQPEDLPPISRTIGKTIRIKREQASLSREVFAPLAQLSIGGLRRIEDRETVPNLLTLEHISTALGIDLMELIAETNRRSRE